MVEIKKSFEEYFKNFVPDYDLFIQKLFEPMNKTIRCNTIKIDREKLREKLETRGFELQSFPWYPDGFEITKKTGVLGNTLEHFLGYFYVQERASMLPPIVLNPKPGELILDIAASPGSKTSQMAQMMENKGIIVANDFRDDRIKLLQINLQRLGVMNTLVIKSRGENLANKKVLFDKVLVDAPCTSVGAMRKDPKIMETWNIKNVYAMSKIQKNILASAIKLTKPGGTIVYSTCTLTKEENEDVISSFKNEIKIVPTGLKFGHEGIDEKNARRIYPQDIESEGFFVSKLVRL